MGSDKKSPVPLAFNFWHARSINDLVGCTFISAMERWDLGEWDLENETLKFFKSSFP